MGQIGTAFRAFFAALFNGERAEQIRRALDAAALPKITGEAKRQPSATVAKAPTVIAEPPPKRSDALTLLAALQREARLVDLVQEKLDGYTDEQIGAAARSVLKDSAAVIERVFALQPVRSEEEGSAVEVPGRYDAGRFRLTGKVEGSGPFRGKLAHKGWQATSVNLPSWTGSKDAALVIAPAEVEVGRRAAGVSRPMAWQRQSTQRFERSILWGGLRLPLAYACRLPLAYVPLLRHRHRLGHDQ